MASGFGCANGGQPIKLEWNATVAGRATYHAMKDKDGDIGAKVYGRN